MSLDTRATAVTAAAIWGASFLLVGAANVVWPSYGSAWLDLGASIYPGYTPGGFGSVVVVTLYAALDGAIVGGAFAWIYNKVARARPAAS